MLTILETGTFALNNFADVDVDHIVTTFDGANIEKAAIEFNGIDPFCALRGAIEEAEVMKEYSSASSTTGTLGDIFKEQLDK